ncbi:hypothetical protein M405DRAFT_13448 [Rhizopogon salebrosus TDB-379]|nr:hypothetical protein M405DRAFT_13448 [Rhizopogon salebrosus TDB-379]
MQGGFLTEEDLEKYLVYGESSFTGPAVSSSSYGYTWQQPHSIALGAEGPSGINRRLTVYPWLDQSVYGMPEVHPPLPSGSETNPSCCNTAIASDPMLEANIWTRMVTRPSVRRPRRGLCYDMQQDVINSAQNDDCLSAESATVVEGPISGSWPTPLSYLSDKQTWNPMDTTDDKELQSDSTSSIRSGLGVEKGGKSESLEKHASRNACLLGNVRLKKAWNRLRRWTATALTRMKSTARLPSRRIKMTA